MMKPLFDRANSHLGYLEPPHSHDPSSVSSIASLPTDTVKSLPTDVQSALYSLSQSTSIVYASYCRLQELLRERFERLRPSVDVDGDISFSESSFFNYANALDAEKTYLLCDAYPDWRHKVSPARVAVQPYLELPIESGSSYPNSPKTILEWWECLQSAVELWCDYAKVVYMPDFEDTVGEYLAIHKQEPALAMDTDDSPLETPLATPTPTPGMSDEPRHLEIGELHDRVLPSPALSEATDEPKVLALGLMRDSSSTLQEFALETDGKVRDERKDSGVGMA